MERAGILIRVIQLYAWCVFIFSWAQMGWVDWKEQKIRNHYILFWLKLILLGYALILGQSLLGELGVIKVFILRDYYLALLGHTAFAIAAAAHSGDRARLLASRRETTFARSRAAVRALR